MADDEKNPSILGRHIAERGIYGTPLAEMAATTLDISAMMAKVVELLDLMVATPAIESSPHARRINNAMEELLQHFAAHTAAMQKLNRG